MLIQQLFSRLTFTARSSPSFACPSNAFAIASTSKSTTWQTSSVLSLPQQRRHKTSLTPRRSKYRKAHKGRVPVRTGGSTSGTTLEHGDFGIRVKEATRLTAKQIQSAQDALKRGIKPIKGARVYLRVFPDIPVCIKGNETRMGKGKGTFEYWMCRAPVGKVIFEIGGGGIAEQIAKDALQLASAKLPVTMEFVTRASLPRVGSALVEEHSKPAATTLLSSPGTLPSPAGLTV